MFVMKAPIFSPYKVPHPPQVAEIMDIAGKERNTLTSLSGRRMRMSPQRGYPLLWRMLERRHEVLAFMICCSVTTKDHATRGDYPNKRMDTNGNQFEG